MVKKFRFDDKETIEIGVDEVGRGPMFGPVYTGAVVLPKDCDEFDYSLLKDSKKFTSRKKLLAAAEYIKEHAIYWSVTCESEKTIDKINILQATLKSMHCSISNILEKMSIDDQKNVFDIGFRYLGLGHLEILSCDLTNHLLFFRRDGGSNGWDREDNYKDLMNYKTGDNEYMYFHELKKIIHS